jgi:hypothetical protein
MYICQPCIQGFPDLLHIGNQARPKIFDLEIRTPDNLYEAVVEVDEQVILPLSEEVNQRNGKDAVANARSVGRVLHGAWREQVWVGGLEYSRVPLVVQDVSSWRPRGGRGDGGDGVCEEGARPGQAARGPAKGKLWLHVSPEKGRGGMWAQF